ncbi:MEMO1 family protein GTOL_11523 [Georgfuchsia toluolica]|uniref:MEMO1 family protein GTOL_11523 n=1 Tax=Georgfuchsia toluolica TaxID=424218 RepID=A0A916J4B5_9PROT|nr:AmmeMemoRadiSam system protein B [Georgfuchsia toluolica]CAG4883640.1 MEMO1 family protein GTOL_11523 [Georgfuchsia toluolica]
MMLRPPAVAGLFYPGEPQELGVEVSTLIAEAQAAAIHPKALIVPHAGYIYSGPVAASAYATLRPLHADIHRVVLLGPVHRVPVRGLATTGAAAFETPLGKVNVDRAAVDQALQLPQVTINDEAHAPEHSLEVHLPFLQTVLDDFSIVPFAVGDATAQEVAAVLELLWGGAETLIVVSSDLSHYLPHAVARRIDQDTADSILHLDQLPSHEQACGATPINGLLVCASRHGLKPQLLDLRNSGDTAGDKSRVVGYGSFAFSEDHA